MLAACWLAHHCRTARRLFAAAFTSRRRGRVWTDDPAWACPYDTNGDGDCARKTCARCHPQYQPDRKDTRP